VYSFEPSNLSCLRELDLSRNDLTELPKSFRFEKLEVSLSHQFCCDTFCSCSSCVYAAQVLDLSYNHLANIPEDVGDGLPNLHHLDLSGNQFVECPGTALQHLKQLL